jgi:hypothetical protein
MSAEVAAPPLLAASAAWPARSQEVGCRLLITHPYRCPGDSYPRPSTRRGPRPLAEPKLGVNPSE